MDIKRLIRTAIGVAIFDTVVGTIKNSWLVSENNTLTYEKAIAYQKLMKHRLKKHKDETTLNLKESNEIQPIINTSDELTFDSFIGNDKVVSKLKRLSSLIKKNPSKCQNINLAFVGPPSTGKTLAARIFADQSDLPFLEIGPKQLQSMKDLANLLIALFKGVNHILTVEDDKCIVPPCVVFIDEVHDLKSSIVQGLLKATEPNDKTFVIEGKSVVIDVKNICWLVATTDRGRLFDAFDTRFRKIYFNLYTKKDIAQIIKNKFSGWEDYLCEKIAHYERTPREALSLAQEVEDGYELFMNKDDMYVYIDGEQLECGEYLDLIAEENGFHACGLPQKCIDILTALGQTGPIAAAKVCYIANCKIEELNKFVMPRLIAELDDKPAFVATSSRGYVITQAGLDLLDSLNIKNISKEALC